MKAQNLIKNYTKMECTMSLEVHILDVHLDEVKENMVAYSEEKGERLYQDVMEFEHEIFSLWTSNQSLS